MHIEVGGVRLFVDVLSPEYGTDGSRMQRRRTLLFLHGGIDGDSSLSRVIAGLLTDAGQVIVTDRRGNGRSDGGGDPSAWTLELFGYDVVDLCEALGVEHPVVIGSSYGGLIALQYAIRHPKHPSGLVILASAARFDREPPPDSPPAATSDETAEPMAELAARVVRRRTVDAYPPQLLRGIDLRTGLPAISCPVLCVTGENDRVAAPWLAEEIAAGVSSEQVRVVRIANAGHVLEVDAPDAVIAEIRAFVADIGPPPDRWADGPPYPAQHP